MDVSNTMAIMEMPLFEDLTREEISRVEKYLIYRDIPKGTTIYKQGEHGKSICLVVSGQLEVFKRGDTDKEALVATLTKGQAVGEMAIIDGLTRSATIRAKTDSSILILKRQDFNRLVEDQPHMGVKILKGLARLLSANLRDTSTAVSKMMLAL